MSFHLLEQWNPEVIPGAGTQVEKGEFTALKSNPFQVDRGLQRNMNRMNEWFNWIEFNWMNWMNEDILYIYTLDIQIPPEKVFGPQKQT